MDIEQKEKVENKPGLASAAIFSQGRLLETKGLKYKVGVADSQALLKIIRLK